MKKVLILGGTRFFGHRLVELLVADGHHVTVITRGQTGKTFGDEVEHIPADRLNKQDIAHKIEGRFFDIVYDNICYSPNEAYDFCDIFNGKINKLVFTSTLATYKADGFEKSEIDFDPYNYHIKLGNREDFSYGEGKKQAEAVFFKHAKFPVVAVRFPIVMGEDDYTRRLHFYIEHILNNQPIALLNKNAKTSFIHAEEAAEFLRWAGYSNIEGPYNAAANGTIAISELIQLIEEVTGKSATLVKQEEQDQDNTSPYSIPDSWYMSNQKARQDGFTFTNLSDWLQPLILAIANDSALN